MVGAGKPGGGLPGPLPVHRKGEGSAPGDAGPPPSRFPPTTGCRGWRRRNAVERGRPAGLVFAYHTVEARKRKTSECLPDALSVARRAAEAQLAREARRVVFLSEHDLAATEAILPESSGKGVVIPPGVDDSFRRPPPREEGRRSFAIPPGAFLFLLAARPDPGKNAPAAVESFLALQGRRNRETLLLVAGQEPPADGVPEGVIYAGPVPHAGMPALFSAADAVVCPSMYESFGLVPLEAMAAGVPVIVPREGPWGDTVRREGGGATFSPDRPQELMDAMEEILRDGAARTRMAEEGKRIAARFTWERCTESWARLLSSVATHGNRR